MFRAFKLVILFILLALDNTAQIMVFTPESEKFLKEVQSYLGVYNKADAKEFIRVFEPVWMGGTITPDQKAQVYETANAITQKKLKAYPEFKNYMLSVMNFAVNARPNEVFIDWHDTFNEVLKNRDKKKISRFIETCSNLFNDNTSLKYLNDLYMFARAKGLKSTYYLRNRSASKIEKSTTNASDANNSEPDSGVPAGACSILDPTCESCQ